MQFVKGQPIITYTCNVNLLNATHENAQVEQTEVVKALGSVATEGAGRLLDGPRLDLLEEVEVVVAEVVPLHEGDDQEQAPGEAEDRDDPGQRSHGDASAKLHLHLAR